MAGRHLVSVIALAAILGGTAGYILSTTHSGPYDPLSAQAAETETLSEDISKLQKDKSPTETASISDSDPEDGAPRLETVVLNKGSNLMAILTKAGLERSNAYEAIEALRDVYNPRKLRAGQEFDLVYASATEGNSDLLDTLRFRPDPGTVVSVSRGDEGYQAKSRKVDLTPVPAVASGTIKQSLFTAAERNGMPVQVLMEMIKLYSYDVDFQRDIHPGDTFEVMYDDLKNDQGKLVRHGDVAYASMTLSGTNYQLYSYTDKAGHQDFYNQKGESYRRALMRTPVNGARISSSYGMRKHPILGYSRMHQGVDFAVPRGTPIFAAGNGTIEKIGRNGGYGNYIRIRHNDSYDTAYGHMWHFAKGLHRGSRVKQGQVIGYVGMTGVATGPHLHFEILKNNKHVNPMTVKMPSGRTLKGKELDRFEAETTVMRKQYAELSIKNRKVASAD